MSAAWMWARAVLRRQWGATISLTLFAGIAGGLVLAAMGVARRTDTTLDRYLAQPSLTTHYVIACPPGVTEEELDGNPGDMCGDVDDVRRVTEALRQSPAVAGAVPAAVLVTGVRVDDAGPWNPSIHRALLDDWVGLSNAPIVVEGAIPGTDADDAVAINEALARDLGVAVGDTVEVGSYLADQRLDAVSGPEGFTPGGAIVRMRVAAVVRETDDVRPDPEPSLYTTSGWFRSYGRDDLAGYGKGTELRLRPGVEEAQLADALDTALPDRLYFFDRRDTASVRRVIDLQAAATWAVALVAVVAAFGFGGQTLTRQVGRVLADRTVLNALGMPRRDLVAGAALRMVPCALAAGLIAMVAATAVSPVGPIGLARRLEVSPGLRFDWLLLTIGGSLVALVTMAIVVGAAAWSLTRSRSGSTSRPFLQAPRVAPVSVRAGLSYLRRRDQSSLLGTTIGTALAVAASLCAISMGSSHRDLVAHPERFGQTWDLTLGDFADSDEVAAGTEAVTATDGIDGLGLIRSTQVLVGEGQLTILAFENPDAVVVPTILEGRAPLDGTEVALGSATLDDLGVAIGGEIRLTSPLTRQQTGPLLVVGRAVLNDGVDTAQSLGEGAIVTSELFDELDSTSVGQSYLVKADESTTPALLHERLQAAFGGTVAPARLPEDIENLNRVSAAPTLLAALIAAMAASAMINSLLSVLAHRRRETAVLRSLGFTRRQVVTAALTSGGALVGAAAVLGVPLGVITARWGWTLVQHRLAIESAADVPALAVAAVVVTSIVLALLAAVGPGLIAARVHPAETLAAK